MTAVQTYETQTSLALQLLDSATGESYTEEQMEMFLATDPAAGTAEFVTNFLKPLEASAETLHTGSSGYFYVSNAIVAYWKNNPHFEEEAYELFHSSEFSSHANSVVRSMRASMFMNSEAVKHVAKLGHLGKFQSNLYGTPEWLQTVLELKGDKFFTTTSNFGPFLSAGIIKPSQLIDAEEASPEIVAKLLRMDLKQHDLTLTYQAASNLSRRYLRGPAMHNPPYGYTHNHSDSTPAFLYDEELHKMFYDRFGVEIYEVFVERVKELIPSKVEKSTHGTILSAVGNYFFYSGPGMFSRAAHNFYLTYKHIPDVANLYGRFLNRLHLGDRDQLATWMSIVSGQPKEEYESLPKDWIVKLLNTFT